MLKLIELIGAFTPWYTLDFVFGYWGLKEIKRGINEGQIGRTRADKLFWYGVWAYGVIVITVIPIVLVLTS